MLTPSVAAKVQNLYAIGNTPANSFTRTMPQGVDASILALGCGDVRNILFTAYSEQGFPSRKVDITCCDNIEDIHLRNIVFFSFLIDGLETDEQLDKLWDIYYHFYVNEKTFAFLAAQVTKLLTASASLDTWRASAYGKHLRFCDRATFKDFQTGLAKYSKAISDKNKASYASSFKLQIGQPTAFRDAVFGKDALVITGFRSVVPAIMALTDVTEEYSKYWETGTTASGRCTIPNPTFAATVSDNLWLHYGSNPPLGYHLATGYIKLKDASPLKIADNVPGGSPTVRAARSEFRAVARAFQAMRDKITIRFATAEALAFCYTLQNCASSGRSEFTANWYRRQFDAQRLELDDAEYGSDKSAPVFFDVIDTSTLSDHFGTLNVLVATIPLLSRAPFSTLHTELLIKQSESEQNPFNSLLCGHTPTVALLLGVTPAEYYTNIRTTSGIDDIFQGSFDEPGSEIDDKYRALAQLHSCLSWKLAHHFSGHTGDQKRMTIAPDQLVAVLLSIYQDMFSDEDPDVGMKHMTQIILSGRRIATKYPCYHRGSLAAVMRIVKDRVNTDWTKVCSSLIQAMLASETIMLGSNYIHEFVGHLKMFDVHAESWLSESLLAHRNIGGVHAWPAIPQLLAATFVVPRARLNRLWGPGLQEQQSPVFSVGIIAGDNNPYVPYHNKFDNLQLFFGTVSTKGSRDSPDFEVEVAEDPKGWQGTSPLIVCFYITAVALANAVPNDTVSLEIHSNLQSMAVYQDIYDEDMSLYKTKFGNKSSVFITKFMPGHNDYTHTRPPPPAIGMDSPDTSNDGPAELGVNIDKATGQVSTIAGRLHINSAKGKGLLQGQNSNSAVELKPSQSPFVLNVVLGDEDLVLPVHFTAAVDGTTAQMNIMRTSSSVDVTARMAVPAKAACLQDLIYPVSIGQTPPYKGLPVTLSVPHTNLDTLPIVNTSSKKYMDWMTSTMSPMMSPRERKLRAAAKARGGLTVDTRLNLKESLLVIFQMAAGLYGKPARVFAVNHPKQGGIHMLIVVSGLRLDLASGSVVADAAAIPLTHDIVMNPRVQLFTQSCMESGVHSVTVDDAELVAWKKLLPSLAERCRTWSHKPTCEYAAASAATIPLSLGYGEQIICTCGRGKLPDDFSTLPHWSAALPYATRVAISPLIFVPFAENAIDGSEASEPAGEKNTKKAKKAKKAKNAAKANSAAATAQAGLALRPAAQGAAEEEAEPDKEFVHNSCMRCDRPDMPDMPLKTCSRCRVVKYCSVECQKADWKLHKAECIPLLI